MREAALITKLTGLLPRSAAQLNRVFEADAELVRLGGEVYGFTTDEYNPHEDYFSSFVPETLGFNVVTCTVSDLLAAGVRPGFFLHAMTLPRDATDLFCEQFFAGIKLGLEAAGCALIGGDTSTAETWSYVGTAFGVAARPLLRSGAQVGDRIYASGPFGSGNRQALLLLLMAGGQLADSKEQRATASPRFASRRAQAELTWPYARFAIDSSDGYINSFACLAEVNPNVGFALELDASLVDPTTQAVARGLGMPPEVMLLGSAGEYELVYGIAKDSEHAFLAALAASGHEALYVGEVIAVPGLHVHAAGGRTSLSAAELPDARALDRQTYIAQLQALVGRLLPVTART